MKNAFEYKHFGFLAVVIHLKYPTQFRLESDNIFPKETDTGILFCDLTDCSFIAVQKFIQ